jgi:hypothetical protein
MTITAATKLTVVESVDAGETTAFERSVGRLKARRRGSGGKNKGRGARTRKQGERCERDKAQRLPAFMLGENNPIIRSDANRVILRHPVSIGVDLHKKTKPQDKLNGYNLRYYLRNEALERHLEA